VTWEQPKGARTNLLELIGVEALGVERESGSVVLAAKPPLQVTEKSVSDLLTRIDVSELPAWAGRAPEATVLTYRYVRAGWKLAVEARRYADAEVLSALVDSAQITTVVADDGQMMTEASLRVRNNGRQHLEIELPPGSANWSAFVGGQPVRPSLRAGRLLLPLDRTTSGDETFTVELTFVSQGQFPKRSGAVALASPKFDVPLKNMHWDLYLPPDYDYSDFGGSMTHVTAAGAAVVQTSFSRGLYSEQEKSKADQQNLAISQGLSNVKEQIASGKLREAVVNYSQNWNPQVQSGRANRGVADNAGEIDQLGKEVKRIQGSNLIQAQNAWFNDNNMRLNGGVLVTANAPGQFPANQTDGDLDVAGRQWEKLEAAQQLAVSKVTPLHVNLPTRGVRYTFTQVLQTELNKPMTIEMSAKNTKLPNWLQRIAYSGLAFVALWLVVAFVGRRREA